ncbi:MAG: flagellar hook-associated protein FlgK [Planctomycetes bacterium]|nr:flagellar hook-associated protein FlgK [Planctomycetota bacterium]
MANYSIAMSGLDAAQKALDIIGNNITNAATDGYHRQRVNLSPAYSTQYGSFLLGGGVNIKSVTRSIDNLLEKEILRQQSTLGQVSQEFLTLRTIENAFGELWTEDGGLNAAMDKFFNSLQDLSARPTEIIWQNQVVSDAKAMAGQFRALGEFLSTLETQITLEVENSIDYVNTLTSQIAELNDNIQRLETSGGVANSSRDERDQRISELSELIGIQTQSRPFGVVNVSIGGIPLVTGSSDNELESGFDESADLGISIKGASNYTTDVQGGKIGGLLSLKNTIASDIHDNLNSLANAIIQQINQYHVQAAGSAGSFTSLSGWNMASADLSDITTLTDGTLYIRVINTSTSAITRQSISIDADDNDSGSDSLSEVATAISAITGVTASVNSSNQLTITADTNYKFDFLPAVLPAPKAADISFSGSSDPTVAVSGVYTGTVNQAFTFTVSGTGSIGNGTLKLIVTDGDGDTVTTLNIGSGYAVGDKLKVGNGIEVSLSIGDLVNNDFFKVNAYGSTDTSGLLAAIGINTFFSGSSATDMAVSSDVSANPKRVATALGSDLTDNTNAVRMADVKDQTITSLNVLTSGEYYRQLITDVGQQVSVKQIRQDNLEVMVLNLENRRSDISGVDINDEAARLLIFEQMFQAMAKYMNIINSSISILMELT